jgi:hypothetical protein
VGARELASTTAGSAFLVAEDALGRPVGLAWLKTERDCVIDMPMGRVERYPWLTLHVFEGNDA